MAKDGLGVMIQPKARTRMGMSRPKVFIRLARDRRRRWQDLRLEQKQITGKADRERPENVQV